MAELAATPKNVADLVDAYEQDPDNIDNLRLLTENLILELEVAQNNSLAHSLEFAQEKDGFIDLIDELTSNNTELEDKLQITIDYWTFALENAETEHSTTVSTMQEDHATEIEQINSQNDDLTEYMVQQCEEQLASFNETFWEGPSDFQAISLRAHGEQKSETFQVKATKDEEEESKSNLALFLILGVLLITIFGLICLVRDL